MSLCTCVCRSAYMSLMFYSEPMAIRCQLFQLLLPVSLWGGKMRGEGRGVDVCATSEHQAHLERVLNVR